MKLTTILRAVLGGLLLVLVVVTVWWVATCHTSRKYADRPAEVIPEEDVEEGLVFEPPSVLERIYIRELQPVRSGTAPGAVKQGVDDFAEAVTKPVVGRAPVYPPVRGEWSEDHLTLAVGRSDGALVRNEYECPDPCRFWTTDSAMGAETTRSVPRLLPEVAKTVLVCGLTAGAGVGIAAAVDYKEPLLVGGAAGAGCVVLKILF